MKFCAYMTICVCLPFVLLAAEDEKDKVEDALEGESATTAAARDPEFKRFMTILDRMPFGQPPPGFNPDAPGGAVDGPRGSAASAEAAAEAAASEVEQQILSSVSVSMLNRSPDGSVFVGFTDKSVQPPRNYLLKVGEKREGCDWLVVSAEPEDRVVKLSKGGVEAKLKLGGGAEPAEGKEGKKKEGGDAAKNALVRPGPGIRPELGPGLGHRRMFPPGGAAETEGAEGKLTGLALARARHQQRLAQQQAEEEQKRQAAEQAKKEREQAQREREQAAKELEEQRAQLQQIKQQLLVDAERRATEEAQQQAEAERRAAEAATSPQGDPQEANPN